jgi:hypothetical protein
LDSRAAIRTEELWIAAFLLDVGVKKIHESWMEFSERSHKFCRKEKFMETTANKKMETNTRNKGKGKWGSRIYNFLASGGLILVLVTGFIIAVIIVSMLS